jgi:hypothetical protein
MLLKQFVDFIVTDIDFLCLFYNQLERRQQWIIEMRVVLEAFEEVIDQREFKLY